MDEYIKRGDVLRAYEEEQRRPGPYQFETLIESVPSADVARVRHGRWISLTECANEGVYCSICKKKVWKSDYALCSHKSRNKLRSDYCPNCGAKMDGGDDNSVMA